MKALELHGCTQVTGARTPKQALRWMASELRAEAGQHSLPTASTETDSALHCILIIQLHQLGWSLLLYIVLHCAL